MSSSGLDGSTLCSRVYIKKEQKGKKNKLCSRVFLKEGKKRNVKELCSQVSLKKIYKLKENKIKEMKEKLEEKERNCFLSNGKEMEETKKNGEKEKRKERRLFPFDVA